MHLGGCCGLLVAWLLTPTASAFLHQRAALAAARGAPPPPAATSGHKMSEGANAAAAGAPSAASAVDFLNLVGLLKQLKRTGWVRAGVKLPESVADHQYRMGVMALLITDPAVDRNRCTMMAIVHDLAEALAGDITPHDGVTDQDKHTREAQALARMLAALGPATGAAQLIEGLWGEYEAGVTAEARLVKDLDKFEMIVQADEYEREQGLDLSDFFASTAGYFKTAMVQGWDRELRERRAQRLAAAAATDAAANAAAPGEQKK